MKLCKKHGIDYASNSSGCFACHNYLVERAALCEELAAALTALVKAIIDPDRMSGVLLDICEGILAKYEAQQGQGG